MVESENSAPDSTEAGSRDLEKRGPVRRGLVAALGAGLLLLVIAVAGGAYWLDSDSGHAFIIKRVEALEPEDGLRIGIGGIEGSIYKKMEIVDLELSDPKGVFFRAGRVAVDWNP